MPETGGFQPAKTGGLESLKLHNNFDHLKYSLAVNKTNICKMLFIILYETARSKFVRLRSTKDLVDTF